MPQTPQAVKPLGLPVGAGLVPALGDHKGRPYNVWIGLSPSLQPASISFTFVQVRLA